MILECYQTLEDRDNPDDVEKNGPFICSRSDAWLGTGYYFWDSNIQWAESWGQVYTKNGYIICQAQIVYNERIFDLWGNVNHQAAFKSALELLKKRPPTGRPIVAREVLAFLVRSGHFAYSGIRAADEPKDVVTVKYNKHKAEVLIVNQRVQICLLDKNNLLSHTFRIVFPEKYVQ
ncbi:hypothetical protein GCM10027299_28810 [Larkinella ripae]